MKRGSALAVVFATGLATACGVEVTGLGTDLDPGADTPDGAAPRDASTDATNAGLDATDGPLGDGSPGGSDATPTDDAAPDGPRPDGCASKPEDCTNGVDDNCNGLVDCKDPACDPGFQCVPAIPAGWTAAAFHETQRPACPSGAVGATDVVVDPQGAAATCACACTGSGTPSCTAGSATILSAGLTTGVCSVVGTQPVALANTAACNALPRAGDAQPDVFVRVDPIPPSGYACAGAGSATGGIPPLASKAGRICALPAKTGGGCPVGQVCEAKGAVGFQACVVQAGAAPIACPSSYPLPHAAATSTTDTRGCGACTCASTVTCTSPALTFYEDATCATAGGTVVEPADRVCRKNNVSQKLDVTAYSYAATVATVGCQATGASAPTGGVDLVGRRTVCCK